MIEANNTATNRLLRLPSVLERIGVSRTTLYRWIGQGVFPRPRSLTPNGSTVAWLSSEVDAWINSKPATNGGTYGGIFSLDAAEAA